MKTRKRHLIILMAFCWVVFALSLAVSAQERATSVNVNGEIGETTISSDAEWTVTGTITIVGKITIKKGATLTINKSGGNRTIKRGYSGDMFLVEQGGTLKVLGNTGTSGTRFVLNGGALYNLPATGQTNEHQDARSGLLSTPEYTGRVFHVQGNLELNSITIQQCYGSASGLGCAIFADNDGELQNNAVPTITMDYCHFKGLFAGSGPVIYSFRPDMHDITMTNTEIRWNYSAGASSTELGIINTNGGTKSSLTISNGCNIHDNKTEGGAAIVWLAGGRGADSRLKITSTSDTESTWPKIHDNVAATEGGGIKSQAVLIIEKAKIYSNSAQDGGGVFICSYSGSNQWFTGEGPSLSLGSKVKIFNNTATRYGGGVYYRLSGSSDVGFDVDDNPISPTCKMEVDGALIYGNKAPVGAGLVIFDNAPKRFYWAAKNKWSGEYVREVKISGSSKIVNNQTTSGGSYGQRGAGIAIWKYYDAQMAQLYNGEFIGAGSLPVTISGGQIYDNINASGDGGAFYIIDEIASQYNSECSVTVSQTVQMYGNTASSGKGGAVYLNGGSFYMEGGTVGATGNTTFTPPTELNISNITFSNANKATTGAAFCIEGGTATISGGTVAYNVASGNGGGFYVNPSSASSITTVNSANAATTINNNKAANGAGIYVANGQLAIRNEHASRVTTLKGNEATANGGAVFMNGGDCTIEGGTSAGTTTNPSIGVSGSPNKAVLGAGIYATGGTTTINRGNIMYNQATNTAGTSGSGGGIYANGTVNFSNGSISNNSAIDDGGGVYVNSTGTLNLSGSATMTGNNVKNGWGGGVYQGGTVYANSSSLTVSGNTKGTAKTQSDNNVYLPHNNTVTVGPDISTSVNLGVFTERTVEGSVASGGNDGNNIPVLDAAAANVGKLNDIFNAMLTGTSNIVDDRAIHRPVYVQGDQILYFGVTTFDYYYSDDFQNPIHDARELYQYMCWVNGINGYTQHYGYPGQLAADIDLSDILYWTPIGVDDHPFTGTFEGNGYIIDGLNIPSSLLMNNVGLFGTTQGATIQDVFITGCNYTKSTQGNLGCIVGDMKGGTLVNSTCSGTLTASHVDCITGGMVGKLEKNGSANGSIQSGYAGTNQTGYQMGGLVGDLAAGCSLYNSYANASFSPQSSSTAYIGGLVGVNSGMVENCYPRVRGSEPSSTYFGWLAGDNTNGTLTHSYIPTSASTRYTASGKTGTQSSLDNYAPVIAPYLYNHSGDNAVGTSNLLAMLNGWVGNHSGYTPWRRTLAGGTAYSATAGDINGDYPVHQYAGTNCVSASGTNALAIDYTATLDAMLERHTSNATLNLYADDRTNKATGTGVVVYIDENVSLLQADDTKHIAAHTCQTLPGSPRSWHFVSSSLQDSYIGFSYDHYSTFNWDPDPCGLAFSSDNDQALFPSDMPAVSSMDLYAFYEPEYHWINLKRGSDSHWHMNATTVPIGYNNETTLTRGKGYLVSIDKDQLLQNRGTLNNGNVDFGLDYTPAQAWAGLVGYNLIGNPYQSYLDFSVFASQNSGLWYDGSEGKAVEPTYAVYDSEMGGYIQYKEGASRGSKSASGILNMHQGFMIRVASAGKSAHFTNDMRTNDGTSTGIREDQPAYPLINLTVTDDEGVNDFAVLELGRDADEGAEKLRANDSKGWLYLHHDSENYGILFRTEVEDYQPLWFEAEEAGTYTLGWETANAEFEALTLVDNITGVVTDMLAHDRYTFEATPEQYASRFKIVIGDYKDIEENEAHEPVERSTFAYVNNGNIVLAGLEPQGGVSLQIIDMTGRVILCRDASHASAISTDGIASGIYVLRLTDGEGTKIQKIVIE